MESIFKEFSAAQTACDGYRLSRTISPNLPTEELRAIWKSCNAHDIKNGIKRGIQKSEIGRALPKEEVQGWVEVYSAYWKVVGEILAVQEASAVNGKVSFLRRILSVGTRQATLTLPFTVVCRSPFLCRRRNRRGPRSMMLGKRCYHF